MQKINELIELCISLSDVNAGSYYNVDIITQSDSIAVYKIASNDLEDMTVSSLCDSGVQVLMDWIHEKEYRDAE